MNNFAFKKALSLLVCLVVLLIFIFQYSNSSILAFENISDAFHFNKNLKIGDINEDVINLQKVLNSNTETQVSLYGAGSPGNETSIFGALTKKAVIKFQELHYSEILKPSGLKKGTGFVGISTRRKLNSLLLLEYSTETQSETEKSQSSSLTSSESSSFGYFSSVNSSSSSQSSFSLGNNYSSAPASNTTLPNIPVKLYATSEYQIAPGKELTLEGEGFSNISNIVHFGENYSVSSLNSSEDGSKISLIVPKDLKTGEYNMWVSNNNGSTKRADIKISLLVTNNPAERPIVAEISPSLVDYNGEITLIGSNFTQNNNSIYSTFGNLSGLSSPDRKTLKFKVSALSEIGKLRESSRLTNNKVFEGALYVENDNGISKNPANFSVKM